MRRLVEPVKAEIVAKNDFSAFGEVLFSDGVFYPWRYMEKRFDPDLNLIDFGKRHYDPFLARWQTTDPAGFVNGYNPYHFNYNNPFRYSDSDGQFAFAIPFLCGVFGVGTTGAAVFTIEMVSTELIIGAITSGVFAWAISEIVTDLHESASSAPYLTEAVQEGKIEEKKKKPVSNNPFDGPVDEEVLIGDIHGNIIPVPQGYQLGGLKMGTVFNKKIKMVKRQVFVRMVKVIRLVLPIKIRVPTTLMLIYLG